MLRAFRVTNTSLGAFNQASASRFVLNPLENIVYDSFEYADPVLPATSAKPTATSPSLSDQLLHYLFASAYGIFYPTPEQDAQVAALVAANSTLTPINPWKSPFCLLPGATVVSPPTPAAAPAPNAAVPAPDAAVPAPAPV